MVVFRCCYCDRFTNLSRAGARFLGWRMFQGASITGKILDDTICPTCSGRGFVHANPIWDIECQSCGWRFTDTWDGKDYALETAGDAEAYSLTHSCDQPQFRFLAPYQTWYEEGSEEFEVLLTKG